jgi:hypothetical protein
MGDSIGLLVHRLLRGPKLAVASPETIEKASSLGHPIQQIPEMSLEESIDKLFDNRKQLALQIAGRLPSCPIWDVPILYLYDEIRQCMMFGMNGTAITFCGIMVEFILKYAIFSKCQKDNVNFDSEAWKEFEEKMTLRPAIEAAKREGLLTDEMAELLHSFATDIRNTYSHFNIQTITKDAYFEDVSVLNVATGQKEVRDISASFTPGFQILAKSKLDEQMVWKVFEFSDRVVRHLLSQLKEAT